AADQGGSADRRSRCESRRADRRRAAGLEVRLAPVQGSVGCTEVDSAGEVEFAQFADEQVAVEAADEQTGEEEGEADTETEQRLWFGRPQSSAGADTCTDTDLQARARRH